MSAMREQKPQPADHADERLERAAAALPVPMLSEAHSAVLWQRVAACTVSPSAQDQREFALLDKAAAELRVPELSAQRTVGAWQQIASRTVALSVRDTAQFALLDQAAAMLPVPVFTAVSAQKSWRAVAPLTVELGLQNEAQFALLDKAAAALPVPKFPAAHAAQTWEAIGARISLAADLPPEAPAADNPAALDAERKLAQLAGDAPQVDTHQWSSVWTKISARTVEAQAATGGTATAVSRRSPFRRAVAAHWRWMSFAATAAMALLAVFLAKPEGTAPIERRVAVEIPEVLDDNYHLQVKYVEGQTAPVVCFFLKDETGFHAPGQDNRSWEDD